MLASVPGSYRFLGPFVFLFFLVCNAGVFGAASIAELKSLAESGDKAAQDRLIEFLTQGDASAPEHTEALGWLRAFARNNPRGQFVLGYLYSTGHGVARDYAKAAECYQAAANRGLATAENNLAYLYQEGLGVEKNLTKAFDLYLASAKQGNAAGQYNTANFYVRGLGTPRDYFQAAKWFQAAAKQGHPVAQHDLGVLYIEGLGVPRNYSLAIGWMRLAAEQRDAAAETDLGRLYETGRGVPLDYLQAYLWFSRAIDDGDHSAVPLFKDLAHLMTPAQTEQAKSMLRVRAALPEGRQNPSDHSPVAGP